ncbi:hypothetical protein ACIOEX_26015, partial [Streptomyces sp. NPDC087850]
MTRRRPLGALPGRVESRLRPYEVGGARSPLLLQYGEGGGAPVPPGAHREFQLGARPAGAPGGSRHEGGAPVGGRRTGCQVLTSRNVRGGPLTYWVLGGLNYQIERRLF